MDSLPKPQPKKRPNGLFLIATAGILILLFLIVVALFFVFSSFTPSLLGKCVAVVEINTLITVEGVPPGLFSKGTPSSEDLASRIEELDARSDVGAVLLILNSPGGSVVATREVYSAFKNLKKPKVAYLREVAASGAYYVATGADYIISDPDTLTGSIGVIATFSDLSELMKKIGVNISAIKSAKHKDIGSSFREMAPEERGILQELINEVYQEFRGIVVQNRGKKLDMQNFENLTDGRILSGRQAYRYGLVDQLGSKKDAILKAAALSNSSVQSVSDVRLCKVSTRKEEGGLFSVEAFINRINSVQDLKLDFR